MEKEKIIDNEAEKVNGGYFIVGDGEGGGSTSSGGSGNGTAISYFCSKCKRSWTGWSTQTNVTCSCGNTELYHFGI